MNPVTSAFLLFVQMVFMFAQETDIRTRYVLDLKVPFFSTQSMTCDHPQLNIGKSSGVRSISWVLPDGSLVSSEQDVDPMRYSFTAPPAKPLLKLYNLTAINIDEDQFGYYHCVVEYLGNKPAAVIRWGLNVNGADFSELLDTYRENAIVGAIAAGVLLFLVGGGCLFWNYRYSNRSTDEEYDDADELKKSPQHDGNGVDTTKFDNAAYTADGGDPPAVVDVHIM